MADKIPVTLLTGYLGAGKTTLVNHILNGAHGIRYAVIVNEFAEIGIDADLIVRSDEDLVELSNGCICCTVRHELAPVLTRLASSGDYEAILIETTGLASPKPIMASFVTDQEIRAVARLNSVVTVVDARTLADRLADSEEAGEQILFADHILLNKTDLVSKAERAKDEALLSGLNPIAAVHATQRAQVPLAALMARQASDLDRLTAPDKPVVDFGHGHLGHIHDEACEHDHLPAPDAITSLSLTLERPLDAMKVTQWLDRLVAEQGPDILRAKGILNVKDEPHRIVMQIVAGMLDGEVREPWASDDARVSRVVFIGRRLDFPKLKADFEAAAA